MAHILLLEDNDAFRRGLRFVLKDAGHEVTESKTGEAALCPDAVGKADVMLTDLRMPWINGIEAILAAKKLKPSLKIIAMSGGAEVFGSPYAEGRDYLKESTMLGASTYLQKPFDLDFMLGEIQTTLAA